MIFVSLGSREYPFDRLLIKLDELVAEGAIEPDIMAQIGKSTYTPKHYRYERYLSGEQFNDWQERADLVISHGGTGALVGALKRGKKVIGCPRLARFGEHLDDHQTQVVSALAEKGYILQVLDMNDLKDAIVQSLARQDIPKFDLPSNVLPIIRDFLEKTFA